MPYMHHKPDVIVSAVSLRVRRMTQKYGIEGPTSNARSNQLDAKNGNTYWQDAIAKETANVGIAFPIQDEGVTVPPGWTKTSDRLVFNLKMDLL